MKKSFWFWMSFVLAVIFATYFSTRIIMTIMGHGNAATIKSVSVSADLDKHNLSQIVGATGISPGTKTFSINLEDVKSRISQIPDVKTVAVRRLANGNISVKVKLHKIVGVWSDGTNFYPLSDDGIIIQRLLPERPVNSIVFHGNLPKENISSLIKTSRSIGNKINYFEWIEERRWNMVTNTNVTILLPEEDPNAAIGALIILEKKHNILSKNVQAIDMRDTQRILVK